MPSHFVQACPMGIKDEFKVIGSRKKRDKLNWLNGHTHMPIRRLPEVKHDLWAMQISPMAFFKETQT
ncbi:hypothetical protein CIHG_07153 [Coccidioides immitis H538.4]|uniref:Uncharacterized protein n=3 Tax=Coccidioides immitis TaxID=5501 RepID=A0A0J8QSB7_COCIT|nr:hypothetical protein CIRG_08665 [Coccidioides immitis RMSCC 2394]KMU74138.1 hypothetical protein CISG_04067 [Coccidioides immitis RMSCC 3703]KMU89219.1 hypothetical protein CIHG_07153 [Coccidioides immitis H538.4]